MRPKTELLRERNHKTALLDFFQYLGIKEDKKKLRNESKQ